MIIRGSNIVAYIAIYLNLSLMREPFVLRSCTYCRPPTDVFSDLTVEVGTSSFALHKVRVRAS